MGNELHDFLPDDPQPGPSWARSNWPQVGGAAEDDLTERLQQIAATLRSVATLEETAWQDLADIVADRAT